MNRFLRHVILAASLIGIITAQVRGQDEHGQRRALLICGLTGDAPHRTLFSGAIESLHASLTTHHGFSPDKVTVLWSDPKPENEGPAVASSQGPATREKLAE